MAKASASDRAHFRRIAEASADIELARQQAAAMEDPAAKIEEALRLSNALLRTAGPQAEPQPKCFSLVERWRALQARGRRGHD